MQTNKEKWPYSLLFFPMTITIKKDSQGWPSGLELYREKQTVSMSEVNTARLCRVFSDKKKNWSVSDWVEGIFEELLLSLSSNQPICKKGEEKMSHSVVSYPLKCTKYVKNNSDLFISVLWKGILRQVTTSCQSSKLILILLPNVLWSGCNITESPG